MRLFMLINSLILGCFMSLLSCKTSNQATEQKNEVVVKEVKVVTEVEKPEKKAKKQKEIILGAERFAQYYPLLQGKKVGIVTNQTGVISTREYQFSSKIKSEEQGKKRHQHIVDFLLGLGIDIKVIFAPEHGFRGKADAGEVVKDGKDVKTGLPIISLYGKNKKPYANQIEDLDVIVFDIQDVGVRFYTYISTLAYVMEAAAENDKKVIVLDRPNPNGHYIDGPVLEKGFESFVGLHHIPIVYGMTIGEYGKMVNGEKWLKNGVQCDLTVIELENYTHKTPYSLPVKPSPNLPNDVSINLYPSLCFFEGTQISVGRGTDKQFQVFGSPTLKNMDYKFIPKPNEGAKNPKHNGKVCYGKDLQMEKPLNQLDLSWLITAFKQNPTTSFFNKNLFFDKLAGTDQLRKQLLSGKSESEIRASWQSDLDKFKQTRKKYLIYKD